MKLDDPGGGAMSAQPSEYGLRGRRRECVELRRLLAGVQVGQSQVLVLSGDAGIGKTALLDFLTDNASTFRIARAAGVESEVELLFAGLHQLCAHMLGRINHLPEPQRDALATALGMSTGPVADRFLVGLAVLTLLDDVAAEQPLLCVIDDAQWLDDASLQVLAFVARRLLAEPIALVFAVRPSQGEHALHGLPNMAVRGLSDVDARALLMQSISRPLDAAVLDEILAECGGNPLALVELPRAWQATDLAGGFTLPSAPAVQSRLEDRFLEQLRSLPTETRHLLLLAAAEPSGDVDLITRAAAAMHVAVDAAWPAEEAGLIRRGDPLRFRHPLIRSAAYQSALPEDRRRAHGALADASDASRESDRRAWHRAQATVGSDEDVAADLERCASRAFARGGLAAAAAFLERAVTLTPEPTSRGRRALAAAQAKMQAGSARAASIQLAAAESSPLSDLERAHADLLRGQLAFSSSNGRDAPRLLLDAARRFQTLDAALACDTYLDALAAAFWVGRFGDDVTIRDVAAAAREVPPSAGAASMLLDALTATIIEGYGVGAPRLKEALVAAQAEPIATSNAIRRSLLVSLAAQDAWDERQWQAACDGHIRVARQVGALRLLPLALSQRAGLHLLAGEFSAASSLVEEIAWVSVATGNQRPTYAAVELAVYRGRETQAVDAIADTLDAAQRRGDGMGLTRVQHAQAVLYNGLGQYAKARAAAEQAAARPEELAHSTWALVELVEAAARDGQRAQSVEALERLLDILLPCGGDWALGVAARSRALVAEVDAADDAHREAVERLGRTGLAFELARAQLLYGECLRRTHRPTDARQQLRTAHDSFVTFGAEAYAQRARRELAAIGERARPHTAARAEGLTAQEAQIARLAVDGQTNIEIGAELFLSPRTVEWHLRKVFMKLGVASRRQLRAALPAAELAHSSSN